MTPIPPITSIEFATALKRCKPPGGWLSSLGRLTTPLTTHTPLTMLTYSCRELGWTRFNMPALPFEINLGRGRSRTYLQGLAEKFAISYR
jgi:hypothetical protein